MNRDYQGEIKVCRQSMKAVSLEKILGKLWGALFVIEPDRLAALIEGKTPSSAMKNWSVESNCFQEKSLSRLLKLLLDLTKMSRDEFTISSLSTLFSSLKNQVILPFH